MPKGFVTSDLHLFARRSAAGRNAAQLEAAMEQAQVFVLNGDIFDFRWSTLGSNERTLEAAVMWLRGHCERYRGCHFHFVLGNHDSSPSFVAALTELADEQRNLSIHPHFLRLGENLFVHGDAVAARGDPERLIRYRAKFAVEEHRGATLHFLYQSAVIFRLHAMYPALLSRTKLAESLLCYFRAVAPDALEEIRHIYFGHTHGAFSDFSYRQWTFHNTGAMIKGVKHRLLEIAV